MIRVKEVADREAFSGINALYTMAVFNIASGITRNEYDGGMWETAALTNEGVFMLLEDDKEYTCHNPTTGAEHKLSSELFSVVVNLYACSLLSFRLVEDDKEDDAERLSVNYHRLRDYLYQDDSVFTQEQMTAAFDILD